MDLTNKQMLVLKAIVEAYIETGEPVGSKNICDNLGYQASPATIRNYMAELTKAGLILQPHTSAGRVPSEKGYQRYVEQFAENSLDEDLKEYIDSRLFQCNAEPHELMQTVADLLTDLLGGFAVITSPQSDDSRIYSVKFLKIGRYTVLAVLVSSSGSVKTRLFRCEFVITDEIITIFEKLVSDRFIGMPLKDITPALLQTEAATMGELGLLMSNVLWVIGVLCRQADEVGVATSENTQSLFESDCSYDKISKMNAFLKEKSRASDFLNKYSSGVYFGSNTDISYLNGFSIISEEYSAGSGSSGVLGLICPIRTNYSLCISTVKYVAEVTGKVIRGIIGADYEE